MAEKTKKKRHADFQDQYRRSSNFNNVVKNEKFNLREDGELEIDGEKEKE